MANLAWGTQQNGRIDSSLLVDVSGRGDYLEPSAAAQWRRMVAACYAATGVTLRPAPGSSAYRPLSIQQQFYKQRQAYLAGTGPFFPTAAYPGTSNHGWARAVDITGYEGNTSWRSPRTGVVYMVNITVWNWLLAHAAEYGFDWTTGDYSSEAWHWESLTAPGTVVASVDGVTNIPQGDEFDMASLAELQKLLDAQTTAITATVASAVRREGRFRLYYTPNPPATLPHFVAIDIDGEPGENVLYANDQTVDQGAGQARNWNEVYYMTADTVDQARANPIDGGRLQKMVDFALRKDSAFTNKLAK